MRLRSWRSTKANRVPEDPSYVLIEGDRDAFRFRARVLEAQAEADDCGLQIGPKEAGKLGLKKRSSLGAVLAPFAVRSQNPPGSSLSDKACYQHPASFSSKFCDTGNP